MEHRPRHRTLSAVLDDEVDVEKQPLTHTKYPASIDELNEHTNFLYNICRVVCNCILKIICSCFNKNHANNEMR